MEATPRPLPQLLGDIFSFWRRHLRPLASVAAVVEVPLSLFLSLLPLIAGLPLYGVNTQPAAAAFAPDQVGGLLAVLGVVVILSLVVGSVVGGALVRTITRLRAGETVDLGLAYREAWSRWPRLVGAQLLVALIALGLSLAVLIPLAVLLTVAFTMSGGGAAGVAVVLITALLTLLGIAVILALVLWIAARFATALPLVMLEELRAVAALRRSGELARGNLLQIAAVLLVIGVSGAAVSWLVTIPATTIAGIAGAQAVLVVQGVANAVVASAVVPLGVVAAVEIYRELLVRATQTPPAGAE